MSGDRIDRLLRAAVFGLVAGIAIGCAIVDQLQSRDITRLNRTVACLQHPTHAISAVTLDAGRVSTPTLVVCP